MLCSAIRSFSCPLGSGSPDPTIRERSGEEAESAPGAFASPAWGSAPLCYGPILGFLCDSGPMFPARYRVTDRKPFRLCFLNPAGDSQAFTLLSVHTTCYCWTPCQSSLSLCLIEACGRQLRVILGPPRLSTRTASHHLRSSNGSKHHGEPKISEDLRSAAFQTCMHGV